MKSKHRLLVPVFFAMLWTTYACAQAEPVKPASSAHGVLKTCFDEFSDDVQMQSKATAGGLNVTMLQAGGDNVVTITRRMSADSLQFPLVSDSQTRIINKINAIVDNERRVVVMDRLGEYFRTYEFSGSDCGMLVAMEDWAIDGGLLLGNPEPGLSEKANLCISRGDYLSALAAQEKYWSLVTMFEAALQNYLCAAEEGSWKAASKAVALSLSGQAPRLENEHILRLAEIAAKHDADAAYFLSGFYCDEGNYTDQQPCKNPKLAEDMLVQAAKMGNMYALVELADSYERGLLITKDQRKALACYQLAVGKGQSRSRDDVQRLQFELSGKAVVEKCY